MQSFRALRVHSEDKQTSTRLETISLDDLSDGEVVVRVAYSDVNFKDALAATGGPVMRRFPMVGGIDLAGTVNGIQVIGRGHKADLIDDFSAIRVKCRELVTLFAAHEQRLAVIADIQAMNVIADLPCIDDLAGLDRHR